MCGLVGICRKNTLDKSDFYNINKISESLKHRGPNQNAEWINQSKNIYLSHRRLSINDLSNDGIQPMISKSGRYVIIFNGEVYNFKKLKKELILKKHQLHANN